MTVASLRGRPLKVLSELAGLLGAEITGTIAVALGGIVLALTLPTAWIPLIGLPVVLAVAGPVGYDMAQSWVSETSGCRPRRQAPALRCTPRVWLARSFSPAQWSVSPTWRRADQRG